MKKGDDIEDLFKKKFENFEADVKPDVWENVQTALKGFGLGFLVKMLINKIGTTTLVVITTSIITVISTVMIMNWTGNKKTETTKNKSIEHQEVSKQVVEKLIVSPSENIVTDTKAAPTKAILPTKIVNTPTRDVKDENLTPLAITNKTNRKEIKSVIDKFSKKPVADIFASPVGGPVPLIVSLINNGTGKINKWAYSDSKEEEIETSPVHIYNEPGIYKVKLTSTDAEGKTTLDSVTIEVVGNPSMTATPPTNVSRKLLPMKLSNTTNIINMHAIIFDKSGTIVFESNEIDPQWDGKNVKGQNVKEGIYFFIINAEGAGGKKYERNGSINLIK